MISLQQLYDAEERAMRAQAEAARYRAALEKIERQNPPQPLGEKLVACGVCERVWLSGEPHTHKDTCYIGVAHRALHPEETD